MTLHLARWFVPLLVLLVAMGCGKPASGKKGDDKQPAKAQKNPLIPDQITVNTNAGKGVVRNPEEPHDLLYTARWRSAKVTAGEQGVLSGSMEGVEGELYGKKRGSSFRADLAVAHRETMTLTLTGNVSITSLGLNLKGNVDPKMKRATLTCDKVEVEWVTDEKKVTASIIKASGNVHVEGAFGTLSGLNEVWATSDLSTVATPSMFKKP